MPKRIVPLIAVVFAVTSCQSLTNALGGLDAGNQPAPQSTAQTAQAKPASAPLSAQWSPGVVDTARDASYLSPTEREVVAEINRARTDPAAYARAYLVPLRRYYAGKMLQYPGEIPIVTEEGVSALDECIRVMEQTKPVPPLSPNAGLSHAARDHAADQARTGAVGHIGSDGSTPESRVARYGQWDISFGENIDYGNATARRIVTSLLIDDGVPSRGHRTNILDPTFRFIGVAVGPHPQYGHMCVMDFAGSYQ